MRAWVWCACACVYVHQIVPFMQLTYRFVVEVEVAVQTSWRVRYHCGFWRIVNVFVLYGVAMAIELCKFVGLISLNSSVCIHKGIAAIVNTVRHLHRTKWLRGARVWVCVIARLGHPWLLEIWPWWSHVAWHRWSWWSWSWRSWWSATIHRVAIVTVAIWVAVEAWSVRLCTQDM